MPAISYYLGRPASFWLAVMSRQPRASVPRAAPGDSPTPKPIPDNPPGCLSAISMDSCPTTPPGTGGPIPLLQAQWLFEQLTVVLDSDLGTSYAQRIPQ